MQVVLIGDSIRQGYEPGVRERLAGLADVWGPTENGGNSRNVLAHLDEWVLNRRPTLVHLNCGLHDLHRDFGTGNYAVPPDEYERNLRHILPRILSTGAILVWASTTPVNQVRHHETKEFDRFEADVDRYNALARRVAEEHDVATDDLFELVMAHGRDELLLPDGVHYTPAGYALLADAVAATIAAHLPD